VLNKHLLDELGHLVLQFSDAVFINRVCWTGPSGADLCGWIGDRFGGNPLTELGQHLIDAGCGESDIFSGLQENEPFSFHCVTLQLVLLKRINKCILPTDAIRRRI